MLIALLTGGIALNSHLTKATTQLAINASTEPVSNSVASVTEDATNRDSVSNNQSSCLNCYFISLFA